MRHSIILVTTIAVAALLAGCAGPTPHHTSTPLPKENRMTIDEAIAIQLVPFADAVSTNIGAELQPTDTITPEKDWGGPLPGGVTAWDSADDCTLPDGRAGKNWSVAWYGPGVADPDATARSIQAEWKTLGVDASLETVADSPVTDGRALVLADPPGRFSGTYADGYYLLLTIGTTKTQLLGATHCLTHAANTSPSTGTGASPSPSDTGAGAGAGAD